MGVPGALLHIIQISFVCCEESFASSAGQSDAAQGKTHRTRFTAGSVRLLSALEKEAAAGGEPAAEKGGRVLMVIRFCSKEEVLGGSVIPPLGVGGRTEICSLWSCICQPPWADELGAAISVRFVVTGPRRADVSPQRGRPFWAWGQRQACPLPFQDAGSWFHASGRAAF